MSIFHFGVMAWLRLVAGLLSFVLLLAAAAPSSMAQQGQEQATAEQPPHQVELLLQLLRDPAVQQWLERQPPVDNAADVPAPAPQPERSMASYFAERLQLLRDNLALLAAARHKLPAELERAWIILSLEFEEHGLIAILVLIAIFIGVGFLFAWGYWWVTTAFRNWLIGREILNVGDRLRAMVARLAFAIGWALSFTIGSVGAFLCFTWPLLLREIVLGYLVAFLCGWLARIVAGFLLAPGGGRAARFRIIPMSDPAAKFWQRRIIIAVSVVAFTWVTLGLLRTLGVSPASLKLLSYSVGLFLLGLAMEVIWRRPVVEPAADATRRRIGRRGKSVIATILFVAMWVLWALHLMPAFWLLLIGSALPFLLSISRDAVAHLLRPVEGAMEDRGAPILAAVALERGLRAALVVVAALLLAHVWDIDLIELTARDTVATRLIRGALSAVVIVLVADFLWRLVRAVIDSKIADAMGAGEVDSEEARRRSRLRTLLPILRNMLLVVVIAVAAMMVLSALGVEIGPLIAGAGVIGVAVGFGAQTLVKDIISGVFYLFDDAFRVGEYIQSGSYKGTVESFSLRSVKLRHHRGPLYTVPFGELGAVQNMSRDWVIDKMQIGITYDSDLDKAKKIIKQVGKDLAADPEYAPNIIEPLKMQGVEQFGEYAIQIRMKMMTKPGEQFVIRRKAYAMIKKAFDANGINFAFPTVTVAQGEDAAAVARQALELTRDKVAPEGA
ncbi:mechanosensitive ion channel family protein [Dongia deserti]|uniref:mechanosensitive ion channel family protein n=1 Tax=Dongia deserti TaxID=2268030 RepID=UPI0013C514F2|nr:mechanosensitive ion channel family protein [Dongia deserti]